MTSIIFGANGQDGFYLSELLRQQGDKVVGVSRNGPLEKTDITRFADVAALISVTNPDYIFHLAANSTTRHDALFENHETICTGTLNILESVKKYSPHCKVFISGSGLQFKNAGRPIKETDEFEARDPYSVSRIQSAYAARYFRSIGVNVYLGYFFNHESPRRTERHMTKMIAEAAKRIRGGSEEMLEIGDTSVIKEYTYAGDIVNAVWKLVTQENIFEANLGSGQGYSIADWLDICFSIAGKDWKHYVKSKEDFVPEYRQLVCDPARIMSLGWQSSLSFDQLAKLMMD